MASASESNYVDLCAGPLGEFIPPGEPHAVSVSLPTWSDTVGWASRDLEVLDKMHTGYPRFFIHRTIVALSEFIVARFECVHEEAHTQLTLKQSPRQAMLFPSPAAAARCAEYIAQMSQCGEGKPPRVDVLSLGSSAVSSRQTEHSTDWANLELHAVLYPSAHFPLAKAFWQHTGFGISSRYAEHCLKTSDKLECWRPGFSAECLLFESMTNIHELPDGHGLGESETHEADEGVSSKLIIRQRVADLYSLDDCTVNINDVLLYPTGMSAITNLVDAILEVDAFDSRRSTVAYGFLYVDTFKILSRVVRGSTLLLGHCTAAELSKLELDLASGHRISAIFIEVPGNPLLMTPDLLRLRNLADTYDFLIITDDTVGTPVNVGTLIWSDATCTSLTKMFSGACNTMGGTVVLNPNRKHYAALSKRLKANFRDTYYPLDAVVMERNSRDFKQRIQRANCNAEMIVALLKDHAAVAQVHHPSVSPSRHLYDAVRQQDGGYSYLLSIIFKSPAMAMAFFDALDVAKGPSLGTNFTLACPYALFAHYGELPWARDYGVPEDLVRISVGAEDGDVLREKVRHALQAALKDID